VDLTDSTSATYEPLGQDMAGLGGQLLVWTVPCSVAQFLGLGDSGGICDCQMALGCGPGTRRDTLIETFIPSFGVYGAGLRRWDSDFMGLAGTNVAGSNLLIWRLAEVCV